MVNEQLLEDVRNQLVNGSTHEKIRSDLKNSGSWTDNNINEAFAECGLQPEKITIPTNHVRYAGFWTRFIAQIIDWDIVLTLLIILPLPSSPGFMFLFPILFCWFYFSILTYKYGATLGKMLLGISVKSSNDKPLGFLRIFIRESFARLLSFLPFFLGYIIAGFTAKKQSLHDKIVATVVVYNNPENPFNLKYKITAIISSILIIISMLGFYFTVKTIYIIREEINKMGGFEKAVEKFLEPLHSKKVSDGNARFAPSSGERISRIFYLNNIDEALSEMRKIKLLPNDQILEWGEEHGESLPAMFNLELAHYLFDYNKEESLKWFMLGQVRLIYDAKRCEDKTAAQLVMIINNQYYNIVEYLKNNRGQANTALDEAIKLDSSGNYEILPEYMCSHGIEAFSGEIKYVDKKKWSELKTETYDEIRKAFQ